jgi:CheY-like chemotaxis protein
MGSALQNAILPYLASVRLRRPKAEGASSTKESLDASNPESQNPIGNRPIVRSIVMLGRDRFGETGPKGRLAMPQARNGGIIVHTNVTDAGLIGVPEGIRVLVAHGNAGSLHVLREMLSSWRIKTVAADGVRQAVAAFDQAAVDLRPFALVILDTKISGGRGLELVQSLRGRTGGPALIVLASTLEVQEAEQYRQLGVRAYLQQPVTQPELMDAITASLASESLERLNAFSGGAGIVARSRTSYSGRRRQSGQ